MEQRSNSDAYSGNRMLKKIFYRLLKKPIIRPIIRVKEFKKKFPEFYVKNTFESPQLVSQLCTYETLNSEQSRYWALQLKEPWRAHRKLWELTFICQALSERGLLKPEVRGLGFAVGQEKLPSFFASFGCKITATDLAGDDPRRLPWSRTGQWASNLEQLNSYGLCNPDAFKKNVVFSPADMNCIPKYLRDFDFTWSTCSFEHCGSIQLGADFLSRQMECLKPGGVAVHTTEFNLTSNRHTIDSGSSVIYRLTDIENIISKLKADGHYVEPLDLDLGKHPLNNYVEGPPYSDYHNTEIKNVKHLRLNLFGYASTSLAIIIRKGS